MRSLKHYYDNHTLYRLIEYPLSVFHQCSKKGQAYLNEITIENGHELLSDFMHWQESIVIAIVDEQPEADLHNSVALTKAFHTDSASTDRIEQLVHSLNQSGRPVEGLTDNRLKRILAADKQVEENPFSALDLPAVNDDFFNAFRIHFSRVKWKGLSSTTRKCLDRLPHAPDPTTDRFFFYLPAGKDTDSEDIHDGEITRKHRAFVDTCLRPKPTLSNNTGAILDILTYGASTIDFDSFDFEDFLEQTKLEDNIVSPTTETTKTELTRFFNTRIMPSIELALSRKKKAQTVYAGWPLADGPTSIEAQRLRLMIHDEYETHLMNDEAVIFDKETGVFSVDLLRNDDD